MATNPTTSRPDASARRAALAGRVAIAIAAAAAIWLLLPFARVAGHSVLVLPVLLAAAAASAWRPAAAFVALAALVPVAGRFGGTFWPAAWAELLVLMVLLGIWTRVAWTGGLAADVRLRAPALAAAAVVVGSLLVQLLVEERTMGLEAFRATYAEGARRDFFVGRHVYTALDAALRLLESLALFVTAAAVTRGRRDRLVPIAGALALGGSAAALLTLHRLWIGALRLDEPLGGFIRYLATIRLNVHYGDLNAAGSYYLLILGAAIGLALRPHGSRWLAAVALAAAGLWTSGSRTALAAAVILAGLAALVRRQRRSGGWRARRVALAAAVVAVAALGLTLLLPERGNQTGSPTAVRVRAELARASIRMAASAPVFGVGIGQYPRRSGEFASPELLDLFPPARSENAHNNYLQVLAELGIAGFAVFAWLAVLASREACRTYGSEGDPLARGLAAGLLAFGLTCLAGHPLLINEPAFTFWLVLGAVAGATAGGPAGPAGTSRRRWMVTAAIAALALATVPARAARALSGLDLEHVGIGVSVWETSPDGVRYRSAGARSTIFLPASAQAISITLRLVAPPARRVGLRLNGRPADVVVVPADRWLSLRLQMPALTDMPRFHRLDLEVEGAGGQEAPLLLIGKVEPQ